MEVLQHSFDPFFDERSGILILGSFPSVKSREQGFYYGHPRNRFWKVIAAVMGEKNPSTLEEKQELLLRHGIALWDVIESCTITGSSDSSIKNVVPADIGGLMKKIPNCKICTNGRKATELYQKFCENITGIKAYPLPSTSPANAAWSLERLIGEWGPVLRTI